VKLRRSLSHVGGPVATWGDPAIAAQLALALDVAPAPRPLDTKPGKRDRDDPDRAHVHGFHTYPARMHPSTARQLVRAVSVAGATVLDPFCGSGTVLVEAMLAGRRAVGTDLNPLAVRLARLKTTRFDAAARRSITAQARSIAAFADSRRARRAGASHRYSREDVALFAPHVLLELDSIATGIQQLASDDRTVREALELVLSAVLVKVSLGSSDTSATAEPRRTAAGFPARLFARKAEELARRLGEFAGAVPEGLPPAVVAEDDAGRLRTVGASTVDAVVTSPPYAATYDYLAQHALRLRWLGLDSRALAEGEIGARRNYARLEPRAAKAMWAREIERALRAMQRACRSGAKVALLMGDSAVGSEPLRADELIAAIAPEARFAVVARASQTRPHFHGPTASAFRQSPRGEHAIVLEKR
jgi:DNA modification methylase